MKAHFITVRFDEEELALARYWLRQQGIFGDITEETMSEFGRRLGLAVRFGPPSKDLP